MRFDMLSASIWSCVTNSTAMLSRFCNCFTSMRMYSRSLASRLLNGSSSSKTLGSVTSARASATRCCCPPLSRGPGLVSNPAMPTNSRARRMRAPTSFRGNLRDLSGKVTFSSTVMWGQMA